MSGEQNGQAGAGTSQSALQALRAAAKGLRYQSESDKPVKAFLWSKDKQGGGTAVDKAAVRKGAGAGERPITELSVDDFFRPMTTPQSWHGEVEKAQVKGFEQLIATLKEHLSDLKAFHVGQEGDSTVDAYVVGRTGEGDLAGVTTQLVET